jgi:hypothetical protein
MLDFKPVLWIRDVYPGSQIQKQQQISCHTFLCSHKFHKIENYFSFEVLKKFGPIFKEIIELFTQKIVPELSIIWSWDPGSGTDLFRIPDQGSKRHRIPDPVSDPGSGSATLF